MQTGLKRCEAQHRHLILRIDQVIEGWKVRVIDTKHHETLNDDQLPGGLDEAKSIAVDTAHVLLARHDYEIDLELEDLERKWSISTR